MGTNPTYLPPRDSASTLTISLGYVNVSASTSGTALTIAASGATLAASDVGNVIQVSGSDGGSPELWTSLWTTIAAVTDSTHATLGAAPDFDIAIGQAIIYRPIQGDPDYHITEGSIDFEASLSTAPTLNFDVFTQSELSPLVTFVPQVGQPVLMTDSNIVSSPTSSHIASATLSVVSAFNQCAGYQAYAAFYVGTIALIGGVSPWIFDNGPGWVKRTDTTTLSSDALAGLQAGALHAQFDIEGSIFGDASGTPAQLLIYETWIDVTFADGSTARLRPSFVRVVPGSSGDVLDAGNANDGDPATYATIERGHFSALGSGFVLQLGTYIGGAGAGFFGSQPGDIFGGSIEQVEVSNIPGTTAYICKVECRSWNSILSHRVLGLANAFPDVITSVDYNGGTEVTGSNPGGILFDAKGYFNLGTPPPLTITTITLNGVAQTFGPTNQLPYKSGMGPVPNHPGLGGFDWYYTFGSLLFQDPGGPTLTGADVLTVTSTAIAPQTPSVTYSDTTADVIAEDLLAFIMGPEGIHIENVVPGPVVGGITFTADTTFDDALSSLLSYINDGPSAYWFYIDPRKGFHFEIQGSAPAPWNISQSDLSDANVLVEVSNATTREKYANSAYISFNKLLPVKTQRFTGDSSIKSFTLGLPCGAAPTILYYPGNSGHPPMICPPVGTPVPPANHVQSQTVGVVGQTGFEWYWSPGSNQITQDASQPAITITAAIYVTYAPQVGVLQPFNEDSAIAERQAVEGGSGEYDVTLDVTSGLPLVQGTPAQAPGSDIAESITKYFSYMAQAVNIKTFRDGLVPAQAITIDLGAVANQDYVVQSVKLGTSGQLKFWEVTAIAGALIGDWKTAIKYMTGGGSGSGSVGAAAPPPTGALLLETDGVKNAVQTQLNLVPGTGVTVVDDGFGNTTISSTAAIAFAREAPAGTLDGANVTFTLTDAPAPPESLLLTLNGVEQSPGFGSPATGADYSISGAAITFTVAPRADDWVMAEYTH
jgi:hypothetical protein